MDFLKDSQLVENLGWTLLHSVWQVALVAGGLFLGLRIFARGVSANARYLAAVAALVLSLTLPVSTFVWLSQTSAAAAAAAGRRARDFTGEAAVLPAQRPYPVADPAAADGAKNAGGPANERILASVENLQSGFARRFSASAPFVVGFWVVGMMAFAVRFAGGALQLRVYRRRGTSEPGADWRARLEKLRRELGVGQKVRILRSKVVRTPMVIGWLKPVILVPAGVFLQIDPRELETILAHELVHIRRHDYLVNFAQSFVEILFFYHPCVWWISAEIRREREFACDEAVTKVLQNSRLVYAGALASLEEIRLRTGPPDAETKTPLLTAATGGQLMKRVERIIEKNTESKRSSSKQSFWSASLALLLISALLICVFSARKGLSVNAGKPFPAEKKMAVGFVSIPPGDRVSPREAGTTARLLIEKLKAHRVPALGFVLGGALSGGTPGDKLNSPQADLVRLWRDSGFEVGIGGFRHVWFYETPYQEYVSNVEKNERVTKPILAEKNLSLRWFSYPYLNTGRTAADAEKFESWLGQRGLRPVKYTFDNQEWMYSYAYDEARRKNDVEMMNQIAREFLDYMAKMLAHFEGYSQEMFGRDIPQTLVLTPSRLVADTSDALFGMFEREGYRFVTMEEALADEAYRTKAAHVESQSGISWFERWQMARGKKLRDEPRVSRTVGQVWQERKK